MKKIIVFKNESGSFCISNPASDENISEIANIVVPAGLEYAVCSESDLHNFPEYFDAFDIDYNNCRIIVNIEKAKEIKKKHIRLKRYPILYSLDIQMLRAIEENNTNLQDEIVLKKKTLRDCTEDSNIVNANSIEDLYSYWPDCLQGNK